MEKLLSAVSEIAGKLKEKGYDYFNVRYGGIGLCFTEALTAYLGNVNTMDQKPVFPIYAAACLSATDPGSPSSWARFTLEDDSRTGLRLQSLELVLLECHDGPQRASIKMEPKSLDEIPTRRDAAKLIEDKWKLIREIKTGKPDNQSSIQNNSNRRLKR